MATKEIKDRIVLEGEKQYSQAVKEAQRNLKTLRSELKAETAELGRNATEQQKNEVRTRSLQKQVKEQEKIVKAYAAALKEVKEKYGDNSDEVAKWEQRLNNARAALGNMRNDLEGVGNGFKDMQRDADAATVATKSVADSLSSLGAAGDAVAGAIEGIFTGMIDTVASAVSQLWDMITETAGRANNWTDLASYYGSSAQELQMWSRSIEAAGGSFEKFQTIVNQLAFGGKEKTITELVGISKENYDNDVQYTLAVLDELQRRKEELGQGWYDDTMTQLFGARRIADVSWFLANARGHQGANGEWINGWRDNPQQFNGNESGYGMSDEELATMNDLYVKLQEIDVKWKAIKENFAAGFGMVSLDLMVNVEGTLDGIADYLNATDDAGKEAALAKIRANVEEFFRKLGEIIRDCIGILRSVGEELQGSDDPLVSTIGDILVKLSEGLQWMVDNADKVKQAFETIFGVWLLLKLTAVAGKLSSILLQIETIKNFRGLNTGSPTVPAADPTGTATGTAAAGGIGAMIAKAVPWLAGLFVWGENAIKPQGNDDLIDKNGQETALYKKTQNEWAPTKSEGINYYAGIEGVDNWKWDQLLKNGDASVEVTQAQVEAIQKFWDIFRTNQDDPDAWMPAFEEFEQAFVGQDGLFDKVNEIMDYFTQTHDEAEWPSDLPAKWWKVTEGQNDQNGLSGLPAQMKQAVQSGMSLIQVVLDGQKVGHLLTPYVSQEIAKDVP